MTEAAQKAIEGLLEQAKSGDFIDDIMQQKLQNTWISTASGKKFDVLNPNPSMVDFGDIAAQLSKVCRFSGATKQFYSVAEHSVLMYDHLKREGRHDQDTLTHALLHDAHEAYIGDVVTPMRNVYFHMGAFIIGETHNQHAAEVKQRTGTDPSQTNPLIQMSNYGQQRAGAFAGYKILPLLKARVQMAITERAGLGESPGEVGESVIKQADVSLLMTERDALLPAQPHPWPDELENAARLDLTFECWDPRRAELELRDRMDDVGIPLPPITAEG